MIIPAKPLSEMSGNELRAELQAANDAYALADYQEGLAGWASARSAASSRQEAVIAEINGRRVRGQIKDQKNGG
jgi:hypothetical protein